MSAGLEPPTAEESWQSAAWNTTLSPLHYLSNFKVLSILALAGTPASFDEEISRFWRPLSTLAASEALAHHPSVRTIPWSGEAKRVLGRTCEKHKECIIETPIRGQPGARLAGFLEAHGQAPWHRPERDGSGQERSKRRAIQVSPIVRVGLLIEDDSDGDSSAKVTVTSVGRATSAVVGVLLHEAARKPLDQHPFYLPPLCMSCSKERSDKDWQFPQRCAECRTKNREHDKTRMPEPENGRWVIDRDKQTYATLEQAQRAARTVGSLAVELLGSTTKGGFVLPILETRDSGGDLGDPEHPRDSEAEPTSQKQGIRDRTRAFIVQVRVKLRPAMSDSDRFAIASAVRALRGSASRIPYPKPIELLTSLRAPREQQVGNDRPGDGVGFEACCAEGWKSILEHSLKREEPRGFVRIEQGRPVNLPMPVRSQLKILGMEEAFFECLFQAIARKGAKNWSAPPPNRILPLVSHAKGNDIEFVEGAFVWWPRDKTPIVPDREFQNVLKLWGSLAGAKCASLRGTVDPPEAVKVREVTIHAQDGESQIADHICTEYRNSEIDHSYWMAPDSNMGTTAKEVHEWVSGWTPSGAMPGWHDGWTNHSHLRPLLRGHFRGGTGKRTRSRAVLDDGGPRPDGRKGIVATTPPSGANRHLLLTPVPEGSQVWRVRTYWNVDRVITDDRP